MRSAFRIRLKLVCLVALLALAALFPKAAAYAADPGDTGLALPKVTAKAGDTLDLNLTITGNPGIMGMTLEVNYDSRLTLTNIKNGEAFKALEMTKPGVLESGCRIHWDAVELTEAGIKDGVVATLTFTVSENAPAGTSCFVRVAGVSENGQMDVYDTELREVDLKAASGSISIKSEEQPEPVRVSGVTLGQNSLSFAEVGQTHQLQARVEPANADDTTVLWSSSDQAVAQVDTNGLVTAVAEGTATITATTRDGGYSATCAVDVTFPKPTVPVTGVELDQATFNMSALGEQVQLQATVEPPNASDTSVRWASSDTSVATVSNDGLVTAVAEGVATIMVSTVDGGYLKACVVTVAVPQPVVSIVDADVTITPQSCTYTGEALTPNVVVKYGDKELVDEIDYDLVYANNTNAGEAYVTVIGRGRFVEEKVRAFTIVPQPIDDLEITLPESQKYTGEAIEPAVTVMHNDVPLTAGTDYTVSYGNNVNEGTATVTVEGKGNYTGKATATFNIVTGWERLAGDGRYDTMAEIVRKGWPTEEGGTVVLANGYNFKDALAAAGLAGLYDAPVVLTDGGRGNKVTSLSGKARSELLRLAPKTIYVAGGPFAVPDAVMKEVQNLLKGTEVIRVAGGNGCSTSAELAKAGKGRWDGTAIIATDKTFKDALSAAPVSYAKHWPILLAGGGKSLNKDVIAALKECGIERAYIVGGTAAVTPAVEKQLRDNGIEFAERLAGGTGVQTSREIADFALQNGLSAKNMAYATSQNFPDALGGAALCGKNKSVLLLCDAKAQGNMSFSSQHVAEIEQGYVFGGESAFSKDLFNRLPV